MSDDGLKPRTTALFAAGPTDQCLYIPLPGLWRCGLGHFTRVGRPCVPNIRHHPKNPNNSNSRPFACLTNGFKPRTASLFAQGPTAQCKFHCQDSGEADWGFSRASSAPASPTSALRSFKSSPGRCPLCSCERRIFV